MMEEVKEFKEGIVRSMKQYNDGNVKIFDNADDLIMELNEN